MITCKEDLIDTYIENDNGELVDAYLTACKKFEIDTSAFYSNKISDSYGVVRGVAAGLWYSISDSSKSRCKKLTLSDFKPQKPTRTEYIKVTESIFDLKEEFERGRLFHNECVIRSATTLAELYAKDLVYRRIEKEVDWKSDIKSFIDDSSIIYLATDFDDILNKKDHDDEFLEICRIRLRATGELPE